jgi:AraC-like DNA-binding protein
MLTKIFLFLFLFLFPLYIYGILLLPSGNDAVSMTGDKARSLSENETISLKKVPVWITFNDHHENGTSENIAYSVSDQVEWIYCIKPGCPWAYVGLSLVIPDTLAHQNSFEKDDSLIMVLRSNCENTVKLQLATFDPLVTKPDDDLSYRMFEHYITVKKESRRVAVPLGDFKTAAWWMQRHNIPPESTDLHLESICRIEWEFTGHDRMKKTDTLIISRVELKHQSSGSTFFSGMIAITVLAGIGGVVWKNTKRKKIKNTVVDIVASAQPLQPRPVLTEAGEWERVLSFLQNNYFDPELNLQKVAAELGFSESRLSRLINEHNPDGFRSLIHDLRIMEAKRLLSETTLNISEIAFKLGYAASSHFNREFKQRLGVTPSNFRKERSDALGEVTGDKEENMGGLRDCSK